MKPAGSIVATLGGAALVLLLLFPIYWMIASSLTSESRLFQSPAVVPRALSHQRWYREKFPDYPPERTAIVPGLL